MSFLVTGFVVGLLGGSLGSGGEHYDFHTPFLEEISGWIGNTKPWHVGDPIGGEPKILENWKLDDCWMI